MAPTGLLELALTMAFCSSCKGQAAHGQLVEDWRARARHTSACRRSAPARRRAAWRCAAGSRGWRTRRCPTADLRGLQRQEHDGKSAGLTLRKLGGVVILAASGASPRRSPTDVERGAVDRAVEVELQDDRGVAQRRGRGHRRHAGDGRELALEDGRHRGRHGLGAGTRQLRCHLDGRELERGTAATGSCL